MAEFTLQGTGGYEIFLRVWETEGMPRALVLLAHGYGEHAGRYEHVAERLTAAGYLVVAPDHHGHGRSGGPRGQINLAVAVDDLDTVVWNQSEIHPGLPIFLLGHSMGGAIALRYAILHQSRLAGLILSGPLVLADAHPVARVAGSLLARVLPWAPVLKLDPARVSRDPEVVAAYKHDPLVRHSPITAAAGAEFIRHADTIMDAAQTIALPTLLMWGEADELCPPAGAEALAKAITSPDLTAQAYPGLYHEIFNEPEREEILDTVVDWLNRHV